MPPPPLPHPPQTPLRRLSQGSLLRLSRSGTHPDAPHGLGFLAPALAELVDEAEALHANAAALRALAAALGAFNEGFASWLYVMNMNALTTDWPQAPTEASYMLAARRAEEDARATLEALRAAEAAARRPPTPPEPTATTMDLPTTDGPTETTIGGAGPSGSANKSTAKGGAAPKTKKVAKPKMSAKEKRERGLEIERLLAALPLEFRGNDPALRRHMEMVVERFLDRPDEGFNIVAFVKPPDLNQARANKCLIALVNRKMVRKDNSTGSVLYHWNGLPR